MVNIEAAYFKSEAQINFFFNVLIIWFDNSKLDIHLFWEILTFLSIFLFIFFKKAFISYIYSKKFLKIFLKLILTNTMTKAYQKIPVQVNCTRFTSKQIFNDINSKTTSYLYYF